MITIFKGKKNIYESWEENILASIVKNSSYQKLIF